MYLHELGDEAASFTKEEMQQGRHQEYEQRLQVHKSILYNNSKPEKVFNIFVASYFMKQYLCFKQKHFL
jgi:hypothetical protein